MNKAFYAPVLFILKSRWGWSRSMIFTHKGQWMLLCQVAHLVRDNAWQGNFTQCVSQIESRQLPKQLPKLHLMPIKPVSCALLPDCTSNIKTLPNLFSALPDIWGKSPAAADKLCLPKALVSMNSINPNTEWENNFPCKLSEIKEKHF